MDLNDNQGEGVLYAVGTRGYSAYEIAVQNGFEGTEEEWLDSLVGPQGPAGTPFGDLTPAQKAEIKGDTGKSAYQISVDNGFIGTEQEWVNSFLTPEGYVKKAEKENVNNLLLFMPVDYHETENASGDCTVLLVNESKKTVMFDTGATHSYDLIKAELDNHDITHIDYFILSHFHSDHYGNYINLITDGLFDEDTIFYFPKLPNTENVTDVSNTADDFKNAIIDLGAQIVYPNSSTILNINNIEISFFNCNDEDILYYDEHTTYYNNYSMCNYIKCGKTKILMTGDILSVAQEYLQLNGYISKCDVLKIPHHGWDLTAYDDFFISANANYTVASLNSYLFETTQSMYCKALHTSKAIGSKNYITGNGAIYVGVGEKNYSFYSNGIDINISERKNHSYSIVLYVDSTYDGEICNGTKTNPFKNLISAIGYAVCMNIDRVTISFLTSYTSNEDIAISSSIPMLTIDECSIGSLNIKNSTMFLNDITITSTSNRALTISNSIVELSNVTVNGDITSAQTADDGRGIAVYTSIVKANTLTISNKYLALSVYNSSQVFIETLSGTNNNEGIICKAASIIQIDNYSMTATSIFDDGTNSIVTGAITNNPDYIVSTFATGDDLDDYVNVGTYVSNNSTKTSSLLNKPSNITFAFVLIVSKPHGLSSNRIVQEIKSTDYTDVTSTPSTSRGKWIRTRNVDSEWTNWFKLY